MPPIHESLRLNRSISSEGLRPSSANAPNGRYARIRLAASAGWSNPSGEALVWANTRAAMQVNPIRPRFENGSGQSVFQADLDLDWRAESAPERVGELLFHWVLHGRALGDRLEIGRAH